MEVGWDLKLAPWWLSSRRLEQIVATASLVMLLITSVILWGRRLSGAFQQSPPASVVLGSAVVLIAIAFVLRIPVFHDSASDWLTRRMLMVGTTVALVLISMLLTHIGRQPWWAWSTLWLAVAAVESVAYVKLTRGVEFKSDQRRPSVMMPNSSDELELPVGVSQQFVRFVDPDLGEVIQGKWRAPFRAGQRNGSIHLSFCPPLRQCPQLEVETVSGPAASTKPALIVPHGARIDIRLDETAQADVEVVLEVFVHQP